MNFEITHQQGGMQEFERTGIYPAQGKVGE